MCHCLLDNILIFSQSWEEHVRQLRQVFDTLLLKLLCHLDIQAISSLLLLYQKDNENQVTQVLV